MPLDDPNRFRQGEPSGEENAAPSRDKATYAIDHSGTITAGGTAEVIIPERPASSGAGERWVYNPHATDALWINITGGTAAANAAGSICLPALTGWSGKTLNAISAVSATTGRPYTAGER